MNNNGDSKASINKFFLLSVLIAGGCITVHYTFKLGTLISTISGLICVICSLVLLGYFIMVVVNHIRGYENEPAGSAVYDYAPWPHVILLICILVHFFCSSCFAQIIGFHRLDIEPFGSVCCYYVEAENESGKTYALPAKITIDSSSHDTIDSNGEIKIVTRREYIINNVFFYNGGYLYFDAGKGLSEAGDFFTAADQSGEVWRIRLTDKRAFSYFFEEISGLTLWDYIEWISVTALSTILFILWVRYYENQKKQKNSSEAQ